MKKIALALVILPLAGLGYLFVKGNEMQEITTEINIEASPEKIWGILENINDWKTWSPIIKESSGNLSVGQRLAITMSGKTKEQNGPQYNPKVIAVDKGKSFHWRAHMMAGFIFTNDKVIEIIRTETGAKLVHKELFKGLLAPIMCGQMEKGVPPMLNAMNMALKDLAEGN